MSKRKPKRKLGTEYHKGSRVMTSYLKTKGTSVSEWLQTCSQSGCTPTSGFPRTTAITTWTQGVTITQDASNVRTVPLAWKPRQYTVRVAFGGQRSRVINSDFNVYVNGSLVGFQAYQAGWYGFGTEYAFTSPTEPTAARIESDGIAQSKLLSSLVDARAQWNLAVTLGEARETAAMIAHTARRLAGSFLAFKKGRVSEAWRQLRGRDRVPVHHQESFRMLKRRANRDTWVDEVASAWMEFNYGWRPLLGDIDSAAKYLAEKHVRGYFPVQEISRAHRVRMAYGSSSSGGTSPSYKTQTWDSCHTRYTYLLTPDWVRKPSTLDELGFTDPYSLVWELLPLSFVTDWFVNVGQVLQSLHEFRQWGVVRGIKSSRTVSTREKSLIKNWTGARNNSVEVYPPQYYRWVFPKRSTLSSLPTAVPLRILVANPFDLKLGQMASALSLMRFAFR